jgi:hypothetical protein
VQRKLTLLWQDIQSWHHEWILEVLSPLIDNEIFDGRHEIVLDNCIVVDANTHLVDPAYFTGFRGRNAFLFREPDEYYRDVSTGVYANFCGVFRMHYSSAFRAERVMQIPVGYPRGEFRRGTPKLASQREHAWVMLGQMNKSTRPEALNALLSVHPNCWHASDGWRPGTRVSLTGELQNAPTNNYIDLLSNSAFCPSPMGNVSQETGRPYAALESGAIPILERKPLMDVHRRLLGKHPLPTFSNWNTAATFVQEMWVDKRALDQLQKECLLWWDEYKVDLSQRVTQFVGRLWQSHPRSIADFISGYARVPGWPMLELLRHHSLPAIQRRLKRQSLRLLRRGRFFERL